MRERIVQLLYVLMALFSLAAGVTYVLADTFMSYHEIAVGKQWDAVSAGEQELVLALMKVSGGGWLALAFFTLVACFAPSARASSAIRWAVPIGTAIFYCATFAATWSVYTKTGAPSPWMPSGGMVVLALIALLIDAPWKARS